LHVHPGMMVGLRMDPDGQSPERIKRDLQVWLRYGVTTVQSMGTDRPFAFDIQREQRAGTFVGARLFSVGNGFGVESGVPPMPMGPPPGPLRITDPDEIRAALDGLVARGASGVKIWYDDWYRQMPKMAADVARTIISQSRELGLRTHAHVYYVDDARFLVEEGLDVLAHMPRDRVVDDGLIDAMKARNAAVIPTITVPESNVAYEARPEWVDDPLFARFLPPGSREYLRDEGFLETIRAKPEFPELWPDLERAKHNTALMYQAGVRVAFGTDTGVSNRVIGFFEHRELEHLVSAGVRPADALRMATLVSADVLGQAEHLGSIEPGRQADLLVLRGNPLESITNTRLIEAVWQDGVQVAGAL
ncbi:MAG: amidohydrolase family protein, partial [Chloroflexota bacterium]|nr:amidohydrolase family protein [Chloroflexota bacterium]